MSRTRWFLLVLFSFVGHIVVSQTINITADRGLSFGDFSQSGNLGGTVSVSNTGVRSSTGSIILLENSTYFSSIFTVTTDSTDPISVTVDQPSATLYGSNGGSITLQMSVSEPESVSVSSWSPAEVHIGGTLTLGTPAENPPGSYSGEVLITFTVNNQ